MRSTAWLEVLHLTGCPNMAPTLNRLRQATGQPIHVELTADTATRVEPVTAVVS